MKYIVSRSVGLALFFTMLFSSAQPAAAQSQEYLLWCALVSQICAERHDAQLDLVECLAQENATYTDCLQEYDALALRIRYCEARDQNCPWFVPNR